MLTRTLKLEPIFSFYVQYSIDFQTHFDGLENKFICKIRQNRAVGAWPRKSVVETNNVPSVLWYVLFRKNRSDFRRRFVWGKIFFFFRTFCSSKVNKSGTKKNLQHSFKDVKISSDVFEQNQFFSFLHFPRKPPP